MNLFWHTIHALRRLAGQRHLLLTLVRRDLASRYRGSVAGVLWSLLLPCSMLGVYYFVFGYINQPVRQGFFSAQGIDYALTLFAGLNLHALLAECIARAPQAIVSQPSYVKRIVFPLHLLPLVVVGTAFVQFLLASSILLLAYAALHGLSWSLLWWPLSWLSLLVLAAGLCLMLSALTVYLRDIGQLTGFVSTFLLFMAPVFYPLASAPAGLQPLLLLNPLTLPVETSRAVLTHSPLPDSSLLAGHALAALVFLALSSWVFRKTRRGFADVL